MTRDDIIRMAEEAGIKIEIDWAGRPSTIVIKDGTTYLRGVHELERFHALAVAAEREACAKVCEKEQFELTQNVDGNNFMQHFDAGCRSCAEMIRARGEK